MRRFAGFFFVFAWVGLSVLPPAWGSCAGSGQSFTSGYIYTTLGSSSLTYNLIDRDNLAGNFWMLGSGDPAIGYGNDNGTVPALYGFLYTDYDNFGTPIRIANIDGNWSDPGVDGCGGTPDPGPASGECMAVALYDYEHDDLAIAVAILTLADPGFGLPFDFAPQVEMSELSAVGFFNENEHFPSEVVTVGRPSSFDAYLDPACPDPVVGYRVYISNKPFGSAPSPIHDGSWELPPSGGALPGGEPISLGEPTTIVFGCDDDSGGFAHLAYEFVLADGFVIPYLIAYQRLNQCCTDADGDETCEDGTVVGPSDCDDANSAIFPGSPQVCGDALNNDCDHPNWPSLVGTNEVDDDLDGLTECQGDCDDSDPLIGDISSAELCDGLDNDCDGRFDEFPERQDAIQHTTASAHFGLAITALDPTFDVSPFAVGARWESVNGLAQAGKVFVLSRNIGVEHPNPGAGDNFGISLTKIGDLTGDGNGELLVGASLDDDVGGVDTGSAHVYNGATYRWIYSVTNPAAAPDDQFGYAVAALGDADGDDVPDFVVGARNDDGQGSATIFSGATGTAIRTLVDSAGASGDRFGYAVTGIEDLDGDTIDEVVVGAYGADSPTNIDTGRVFVFSGANGNLIHDLYDSLGVPDDNFGRSVAAVADVDNDGTQDILIGAPALLSGGGSAYVFSGATGTLVQRFSDPDGQTGDAFGFRLTGLDDIDGDGVEDFLIGSFLDDTPLGANSGSVSVISGATRLPIVKLEEPMGESSAFFGTGLARLNDFDGDGIDDFVAGGYGDDSATDSDAGMVRKFHAAAVRDFDGDLMADRCDTDDDNDGFLDVNDCSQFNAIENETPLAITNLRFSSRTDLAWDPPANGRTQVFSADLIEGAEASSQFCNEGPPTYGTAQSVFEVPTAGQVLVYLARGENACGNGTLGSGSAGEWLPGASCP